jgi:hypothetical protein
MPTTAASLQVVVGADIAGALGGLRRVNSAVLDMGKTLGRGAVSPFAAIGGAVKGALGMLGGIGLAANGIETLIDGAGMLGTALGVGLAADFEDATAQLTAFTKSGDKATALMQRFQAEADATPFSSADIIGAGVSLLPVATQTGKDIMGLVKQAEVLAALNPAEGLGGAAFSLREAMSGDWQSIVERFNLPRSTINRLRQRIKDPMEVIRQTLATMGVDEGLVARMSETARGRLSTFGDAIASIRREAGTPILESAKTELERFAGILTQNKGTLGDAARGLGQAIGRGMHGIGEFLGTILQTATNIAGAHGLGLVQSALIATELRIGELFGAQSARTFHDVTDTLRRGVQWLLDNAPKLGAFMGKLFVGEGGQAGLIETVAGALNQFVADLPGNIAKVGEFKDQLVASFQAMVADLKRSLGMIVIQLGDTLGNVPGMGGLKAAADFWRRELGITPVAGTALRHPEAAAGFGAAGPLLPGTTVNVTLNYPQVASEQQADAVAAQIEAEVRAATAAPEGAPGAD